MADITNSTPDSTLNPASVDTTSLSKKAGDLRSNLEAIIKNGRPWPQTTVNAGFGNSSGFLPPLLISPNKDFKFDTELKTETNDKLPTSKKFINYEYEDWMGQKITPNGLIPLDTTDRFNESKNLPKSKIELKTSPYSTRDNYLIFNDNATDYFKYGLQTLNNLTPIENPLNGSSDLRLSQFKSTPFENNDPVIFGFEIVIDGVSSPLLNGSISDFLENYKMISEVKARIPVYEDFKQQFIKFFKTKGTIKINDEQATLSKTKSGYPNSDSPKSLFQGGRNAYMNHYLKKVEGMEFLVEGNTSAAKKYLVDYRKDIMKLSFSEDVSLSVGTLAHLYKLLYWSKPNGKSIVPENLLRFNCDIIVSECRNFNRVRKAVNDGDVEVLKDNLSRYVYSLKECQFFFNTAPHPGSIDLGSEPKIFEDYSIEFDYKYSTVLFERFLETSDGFGKYAGYDAGSIWKVGNAGERSNRSASASNTTDTSIPRFFTQGQNKYNQNGVTNPFIIKSFGKNLPNEPVGNTTTEKIADQENTDLTKDTGLESSKKSILDKVKTADLLTNLDKEKKSKLDFLNKGVTAFKDNLEKQPNFIERLKESTKKQVKREIATLVNSRVNLLSRTINKLGIGLVGGKGITPPKNLYGPKQGALGTALTNVSDRFFYDIRNDLADFAGSSLSSFLNGSITGFKK